MLGESLWNQTLGVLMVSQQRPVGLSTYAELVVRVARFLRKEDSL